MLNKTFIVVASAAAAAANGSLECVSAKLSKRAAESGGKFTSELAALVSGYVCGCR